MGQFKIENNILKEYIGNDGETNIVVPKGVVSIASLAFMQNDSLGVVTLPEGLKVIGDSAFSDCYGMPEVILPSTLERIESHAFYETDIERITLPRGLKFIGWGAFGSNLCLKKITYLGTVAEFNKIQKDEPLISYRNPTYDVQCTDGIVTLREY